MAISTFSFFLPLPFFAAAGGFGGAGAFGAFGALLLCAPPAPTRASVLLRSSMAASEARALMMSLVPPCLRRGDCRWWLSLLVGSYCSVGRAEAATDRAACCERYLSDFWCSNGSVALVSQLAPPGDCALLVSYSTLASQLGLPPCSRRLRSTGVVRTRQRSDPTSHKLTAQAQRSAPRLHSP